jgi:hypothetical protein
VNHCDVNFVLSRREKLSRGFNVFDRIFLSYHLYDFLRVRFLFDFWRMMLEWKFYINIRRIECELYSTK